MTLALMNRVFAETAAKYLGTEHHHLEVNPKSPLEILEKLVWHFDEPFADASAIPCYYLSQLTREHVTVALTGDGGDELFAGYSRYRTINSLTSFDSLPSFIRRTLTGPWVDYIPSGNQNSALQRLANRLRVLRVPFVQRYVNWITEFPKAIRSSLYNSDFAAEVDFQKSADFIEQLANRCVFNQNGIRAIAYRCKVVPPM